MTRIAALNDWSVGSSEEEDVGPTREALEAQANKDYNEAIVQLAHHNLEKALENFNSVLQNPYVEKACWPDGVKPEGTLPQDVALRYSCLKNLGNLAATQGDHEQATKHYLEAVQLDSTEVTVWLRLGASAIKLKDFELSLVAFQEGLLVNPKHWPCLDQMLSVLFILEMYMDCLGLIISALKRDPHYTKANAFKDKIFDLQPSLVQDVKNFYKDSDVLFHNESYDHTLGDKFIKTCELLRPPCKTPQPPSPFQLQHLRKPLNKLTWNDLAESLIDTYDDLVETEGMAFASRIDVHEALKLKEVVDSAAAQESMEVNGNFSTMVNETNPIIGSTNVEGTDKLMASYTSQESKDNSLNSKTVDPSCPLNGAASEGGKKITANNSPNIDERINAPGTELTDACQVPRRIPSRRQTIELGESQDSFRVSEKRRSVDSDTFSHPDDELRTVDEGLNLMSEKTHSSISSKDVHGNKTERDEINDCKDVQDSGKSAFETKDAVEVSLSNALGPCKEKDQSSYKRTVTEVARDSSEDRERKKHKADNISEKMTKDLPVVSVEEKNLEAEKQSEINKNLQEKAEEGETISGCRMQRDDRDRVYQLSDKPEKQCDQNDKASCAEMQEKTVPNEANKNIQMELHTSINEQIVHSRFQLDSENRNSETTSVLNTEVDKEANVSRAFFDQEEIPATDVEEDQRGNYLEDMEGGEGEQEGEDELRENEEEDGLEDEAEDEEGVDEEGELLAAEVNETEAAVNALKGIMALQPTEILGLPEPEFDYENDYAEYFDGGVYEDDDDEAYQEDQEAEDEMVQEGEIEGMEQVEGMEQEGLDGIEEMEQGEGAEQVERINEAGVEQEEGNDNDREQQEALNRENEEDINEDNMIEGDIEKAIAEQLKSLQNNEEEQQTEKARSHEVLENEERLGEGDAAEEARTDQEEFLEEDAGQKSDTEQAEHSENQKGSKEMSPDDDIRQEEFEQQEGEAMDLEDNGGDESEYREDDQFIDGQQKENQNEEEIEAGSVTEKRNSTEDDTIPQETDTDAEGSKIINADKDESNKESCGSRDTTSKTNGGDNTNTEATNKTEEGKTVGRVGRKPKRHKRGLERELEQLDYWGRRQERDAKRRRRTISSKLLGTIEETEYLTWGDLLRSFIPTSLLTCNDDKDITKLLQQNLPTGKSDDRSSFCGIKLGQSDGGAVSSSSLPNNTTTTEKGSEGLKKQTGCDIKLAGNEETNAGNRLEEKMDVDLGRKNYVCGEKEKDAGNIKPEPENPKEDCTSHKLDCSNTETAFKKIDADKEKNDARNTTKKEEMNDTDIDKKNCPEEETEKLKAVDVDSFADMKKKREELILSPHVAEEEQVEAFLLRHENNGGILDLLQPFLIVMWKRHRKFWPVTAAKIFTNIYPRVRNHVRHGEALDLRENTERLYQDSMLALTHWELVISLYHTAKINTPPSEQRSLVNPFSQECEHLEDDLMQLTLMLGRGDIWMAETPQIHTRLRWLQAQVRLGQDQPEQAVSYLHLLMVDLERLSEDVPEFIVEKAHVEVDHNIVSHSEVRRHLNFLQRSHMLEQVVDNYTDGRYQVVAELLTTIFHEPPPKSRHGVTLPTRQTQLAILIDSLFKLKDYKGVITWGAQGLAEALMRFNRAEAEEEKNRWAKTLMKISETMNTTLEHNISIMDKVERVRVVQLVMTLISMLVIQLEKSPSAQVLPFDTLSPWILLHRMLVHEEQLQKQTEKDSQDAEKKDSLTLTQGGERDKGSENQKELQGQENSAASIKDETVGVADKIVEGKEVGQEEEGSAESKDPVVLYPSTLFLITAHDELGKHSWCSFDEGVLLLYCLDVLVEEGQRGLSVQHRQLLHHTLEQVSFCLYSHPSKKSKHKHLRDHGVTQIALCWDRALQLYRFYCPPQLPDFQSSQIPSITDDVAALFKRIIALFPDENQPENHVAVVEAYIKGEEEECNYTPINPPSDIVRDCFYLLGDYYFKNKEWNNAIKYYKLDLTINPDRLESWAPLGLAMKAILETQLNSCEIIQDLEEFFAMAQAGVRCLHQALQLDEYHTNLWVEFGGLVYMVHSHASRLLKQDLNPDISLEMFELLEKLKGEMLNKAEQCFAKALDIQEEGWDDDSLPDERWLHCYMLGKVSEKQTKPPETILQYYLKASEHLHNIQARYPNKINYNSPQEYSVEALEMYYRPHAYILKYLQHREGKSVVEDVFKTFTKYLNKFAKGPFACCKEWKSTVDDKTDACGDETICNTDTNTVREDYSSQKRKRENEDKEVEPVVKKAQMPMQSEDKMDIIKDVINELIHDAVELASHKDDKESEGTDELENDEGGIEKANEGTCKAGGKERRDSDDDIQVVEEKVIEKNDHIGLIGRCITSLKLCLSRFPQHYKSLYRLAYYYNNSKFYRDCNRARNYLLGCDFWQRVGYMPVNGLFYERKVWIQQPRNCNFFHGVWRIPNDEVDRPGSFAAHMYRCVSLTLDVLPQVKDFYSILQIALALKNSPEKDKKYLRDNERELLSEHATQVGLQTMKDKNKILFKDSSPIHGNRRMTFLLDVFRSYKQISRHLPGSEPHLAKMLTDTYASYRGIKQDNRANILREADAFCTRNQHLQHRITTVAPASVGQSSQLGQASQSSTMTGVPPGGRRGRPPGTGRGRGRGRGTYFQPRSPSNLKAIQEAYKLYENLLRIQTLISSKTLDQAGRYTQQKELEYCQAELLKYLRIPCVSQYFQSTLQGNTPTAKLPPPTKVLGSASTVSPTSPAQAARTSQVGQSGSNQPRPALSTLAARSQAHGISITSVPSSKPSTTSASTPVKPSMSVTVSPVKTSCPPALQNRGEISVISVSRSNTSSKTIPSSSTTSTVSKLPSNSSSAPSTTSTSRPSSPKPVSSQSSSSGNPQANTSVPKLPAGTTLTRPRDSPNKSSGPRPQLQAQARPAKTQNTDSALDGLSSPLRKVAAEIMSSTSPSTARSGNSGNGGKVGSSGQANKPSLPKGMTITPAPRVKSKSLVSPSKPPVTSTQSSSYIGAYQASLGLGGNKPSVGRGSGSSHSVSATVIRGEGRNMPTSPGNKQVTQLSTAQLMQLAYGRGSSSGNISGLLNQISNKQPVTGQSRPQARHPGSTPQRFPAPSLQRPQPSAGQRGPQPRPGQQIRSQQSRQQSPNKPAPKSGQDKNENSDDIITLD